MHEGLMLVLGGDHEMRTDISVDSVCVACVAKSETADSFTAAYKRTCSAALSLDRLWIVSGRKRVCIKISNLYDCAKVQNS